MKKSILFTVIFIFLSTTFCSLVTAQKDPDTFGIYTSNLDGSNFKLIISDPHRELNHARVSPDHKLITFSRFNKRKFFGGLAEEDDGYLNTQILIARIDGTGIISLTPTGKYNINVNSYWTPDGKGLLYMSNDNPDKTKLTIKHIDIDTRKITDISSPIFPWVSDPQQVGKTIVFPAAKNLEDVRAIWVIDLPSKEARQLTHPELQEFSKKVKNPSPGDSDPKISPDGKQLALTRHRGDASFENVVVDLKTGTERILSPPGVVDVMPEWSSDGKLLIFWHVDMENFKNIGIYTVKLDGTERRKIPLPPGYHFKMPAFFPGEGSSPDTRIIFSGKIVPQIR